MSLRDLKTSLRRMPISLAHSVASRAAPAITGLAVDAYHSGRTVYGEPRPAGVDGQALTLQRSGATLATLRFIAAGTIVRCVLGTPYARYLIGRYGILPSGPLPAAWDRRIAALVRSTEAPL